MLTGTVLHQCHAEYRMLGSPTAETPLSMSPRTRAEPRGLGSLPYLRGLSTRDLDLVDAFRASQQSAAPSSEHPRVPAANSSFVRTFQLWMRNSSVAPVGAVALHCPQVNRLTRSNL